MNRDGILKNCITFSSAFIGDHMIAMIISTILQKSDLCSNPKITAFFMKS